MLVYAKINALSLLRNLARDNEANNTSNEYVHKANFWADTCRAIWPITVTSILNAILLIGCSSSNERMKNTKQWSATEVNDPGAGVWQVERIQKKQKHAWFRDYRLYLDRYKEPGYLGRIQWSAPKTCLHPKLRRLVHEARRFGDIRVNSTCRSVEHNARVGGARRSYHLTGDAVDLRIFGDWEAAAVFLSRHVGGYKHYGDGLFHIDVGPKRRF